MTPRSDRLTDAQLADLKAKADPALIAEVQASRAQRCKTCARRVAFPREGRKAPQDWCDFWMSRILPTDGDMGCRAHEPRVTPTEAA